MLKTLVLLIIAASLGLSQFGLGASYASAESERVLQFAQGSEGVQDRRRLFLEVFEETVFNDFIAANFGGARTAKWVKPARVKVVLEGSARPSYEGVVENAVEEIAVSTGHDIQMDRGGTINIVVVFSDQIYEDARGKFRSILEGVLPVKDELDAVVGGYERSGLSCFGNYSFDRHLQAQGAVIFIANDQKIARISRCVAFELARTMGLLGVVEHNLPTVLYDNDEFFGLTAIDRQVLKVLYSSEVTAAMEKAEAMKIAASLYERLP